MAAFRPFSNSRGWTRKTARERYLPVCNTEGGMTLQRFQRVLECSGVPNEDISLITSSVDPKSSGTIYLEDLLDFLGYEADEKEVLMAHEKMIEAMLSEEGRADLRKFFDSLDKDKNGKVSSKEWGHALGKQKKVMSKYFGGSTPAEIGQAFRKIDENKDGDLSWEEFVAAAESRMAQMEAGKAKLAEQIPGGQDGNGKASSREPQDDAASKASAPRVWFTDVASEDQVLVSIMNLGGESISVVTSPDMFFSAFKAEIAPKLGFDVDDFRLVHDASEPELLVQLGSLSNPETKNIVLYVIKHTTLKRHEAVGLAKWREIASALANHELGDHDVLELLRDFLDAFPAMVNLQWTDVAETKPNGVLKPLLLFAVMDAQNTICRQNCVDELLRRGARVHIRHQDGFLVEVAKTSGSAFADYLQTKQQEFETYEQEAADAWRDVSSKLCGETSQQVHDENEMTRIVREFCKKYPEMVNFQSNHALGPDEKPYGYFGYASLISFAGAQACRRRRGRADEDADVRKGSAEELMRNGTRVDIFHGGRTALEWMEQEGSLLLHWFNKQLNSPMPEQEAFEFSRD